ncbi:nucleotidyltransferase family protein [Permianibacter sp. IMCC34836]|uniref:nucleotidyltransferase domain-containing protein n=1 Tax=Permianibacter fluminis TaxID=2738515 RepID=UPI0015531BE2|nr:nucleotidyltransferase family protein [Permianibacter fluminis]NQD35746.1 nucleotidyltransferase family protein [Permianibacter fluminis]
MSALPLVDALLNPAVCAEWSLAHWDAALRQARSSRLLPSLALKIPEKLLPDHAPVQRAVATAKVSAAATANRMRWEIDQLVPALNRVGVKPLLLKGAAYLAHGLPASRGRLFSDIDLLVPRERLAAVEDSLRYAGYVGTHLDAYDQRYYRQWMHELPPLQHMQRLITLDVHHNILPLTARAKPSAEQLFAHAVPVAGTPFWALSPVDMVLHSICHLFYDGEWDHALRDLWDIHQLLNHFGADPEFWAALPGRAITLDLQRPLAYALEVLSELFDTAIPASTRRASAAALPASGAGFMRVLFLAALRPDNPSCHRRRDDLARFALYVRGHYLRMPPHLLLPHLLRKALRRDDDHADSDTDDRKQR